MKIKKIDIPIYAGNMIILVGTVKDFEYFQYTQKIWIRTNPNAKPKIKEYPLSFKNEWK